MRIQILILGFKGLTASIFYQILSIYSHVWRSVWIIRFKGSSLSTGLWSSGERGRACSQAKMKLWSVQDNMSSSYNLCLGLFGNISLIFQLIKFVNAHGRDLLRQQHFGSHSVGQNQGDLPGIPPHAASSGPGVLGLLFSVMNRLQNPVPTVPSTPQVNLTTESVCMLLHPQEPICN